MKFQSIFFSLGIASIIAFNGISYAKDNGKCPSLDALKAEGIPYISRYYDMYGGYNISSYGTNYRWIFLMGKFENYTTHEEALKTTNEFLNSMHTPGRFSGDKEKGFGCTYSTDKKSENFEIMALRGRL